MKTSEVGSVHIHVHDKQLSKLLCWGIQLTSVNGVGSRKFASRSGIGCGVVGIASSSSSFRDWGGVFVLWGWCLELAGRIHLWNVNCLWVTLAGGSCDPAAALPCWRTLPESFKHTEHRRKEKNQVWLAHCNECSRRWASYKMLMTWSRQKHRKEKQRLCGLFVLLQEFSAASLMVFPFPPQRSEAKILAI